MARLVIAQSARARWGIVLHEGVTRVGRAADQDLRIDDPSVAKDHCEVLVAQGRVFVRDLSSGLDTLHDGSRVVGTTRVRNGAVLRIGNIEMRIESEFSDLEPMTSLDPVLQSPHATEDRSVSLAQAKSQTSPPSRNHQERGQPPPADTATGAAVEHQVRLLRRLCAALIIGLTVVTLAAITLIAHCLVRSK